MIRRTLDSLTSRRASAALMLFVALTGALGAWIPQRATTPQAYLDQWQTENPALGSVVQVLGLDHVFSTWWYLSVLAVFLVSLSVATWRMARVAVRRLRVDGGPARPHQLAEGVTLAGVRERARALGFREVPRGEDDAIVFRRHPVGHLGPVVMHAGMVLAVVAALVASAYTSRGIVDLSAGEVFEPGATYLATDGGALSSPPNLGRALRLDGLQTQAWPTGELKSVTAVVSLRGADGEWAEYRSTVNEPLRVFGHTIYVQPGEFGDAAFLRFTAPDGEETRVRMEFTFVPEATAGYSDVILADGSTVEGRWDPYAVKGEDLLALRMAGEESTLPVGLVPGGTAQLRGYTVEFVERGEWARLIVVRPFAIGILFVGFTIIGVGSLMIYGLVPRELTLVADGTDAIRYAWRVPRMPKIFDAERERLLSPEEESDS